VAVTWRAVSFWTENLTKVLIWSFPKIDVPSMMRIKTQIPKNKVFKTKVLKTYLTLNLKTLIWQMLTRCILMFQSGIGGAM
jgi:hypothetical protein